MIQMKLIYIPQTCCKSFCSGISDFIQAQTELLYLHREMENWSRICFEHWGQSWDDTALTTRLLKWQTAVRIGDLCMTKSRPRQPPKGVFYPQWLSSQNLALSAMFLRQPYNFRSSCRLAILQSTRELSLSFWFKIILSFIHNYFYLLGAFKKMVKIFKYDIQGGLFLFSEIFFRKIKAKKIPDVKFIEMFIANFSEKIWRFFSSKTVAPVSWKVFFGDKYYRILKWSKRNMEMGEHSQKLKWRHSWFPRRFATALYIQTIRTVKSHSRARATFQNIAKAEKQKVIWN